MYAPWIFVFAVLGFMAASPDAAIAIAEYVGAKQAAVEILPILDCVKENKS